VQVLCVCVRRNKEENYGAKTTTGKGYYGGVKGGVILEIWKDIPGFEGRYQVSNIGRIKSVPRTVNNGTGKHKINGCIRKQQRIFCYLLK